MDPNYKALHQQADRLHNKFLDMRDDRGDQMAKWLEVQTRDVREDMEQNKSPRSIETRIQAIIKPLEEIKRMADSSALSGHHAGELVEAYEHLRQELRRLPNY